MDHKTLFPVMEDGVLYFGYPDVMLPVAEICKMRWLQIIKKSFAGSLSNLGQT
jgi:hypothetical protein